MAKSRKTEEMEQEIYNASHASWKNIPHEDKVAIVGGGREGWEARQKHGYEAGERIRE
jgi:hypothetical protein